MQNYTEQFQQYWTQFSAQLHFKNGSDSDLSTLLINAYSESQRHYHTVQHIVECIALLSSIKTQLNDPVAVEWAIWFHDVVYNPRALDNEERSAELMRKHCVGFMSAAQLGKVYQWITATQKHQPSNDRDLNYLLDIDRSILGRTESRFAEYEQQIQREYSWVELKIYRTKRAEVLRHFYEMQPIYQTAYFRELFEDQAKQNLMKVII